MSDSTEPVAGESQPSATISNRRLLVEMVVITLVVSVTGLMAASGRFFAGVLFGGALALVNFLWLDRSLAAVFKAATEGVKPRFLAVRYILRYVVIGVVLLGIYLTDALPVVAVIIGLASFAFAVVFDGLISILRNP
jgi:hypothetical protein